jgi:plasmid stabilization system protein ParE
MAYKLIWSPTARDDLHDIIIFIARHSPEHAMSFGYELLALYGSHSLIEKTIHRFHQQF